MEIQIYRPCWPILVSHRYQTQAFLPGFRPNALNWDFEPAQDSLVVHPGGIYEARYRARNRSSIGKQEVPLAEVYGAAHRAFAVRSGK